MAFSENIIVPKMAEAVGCQLIREHTLQHVAAVIAPDRITDGASLEASCVFSLTGDSDVGVRVCTPTADEDLLAQKTFSK